MTTNGAVLSQELWKTILEFTSVCSIRIMDTILLEDTCEMGERIAFDEETEIMKYRPVSRIFADAVLELITSISVPQDTAESRSGKLQKLILSRPVTLQDIELFYPSDRLQPPSPLDSYVWEQLAMCNNLRRLTIDQNSYLSESNLRVLSEKNGGKILSLTFCSDISDGILNLLPGLFPNLENLVLQAKSTDQIMHTNVPNTPDMSQFTQLKQFVDKDAELFRSKEAMRSLSQMPSLVEFHIGENENFTRKQLPEVGNGFAFNLAQFAVISRDAPIQKLEQLHICGSYLMRGISLSIDDTLQSICRTFTNLRVLSIKYASCLLSCLDNIKSLSFLTSLETLDLRKSEIAVLKVSNTLNFSVARTSNWCDEYLPYFPTTLKTLLVETEASAHNIFNYTDQAELKACMDMLKSKISFLPNIVYFRCEAFPTFSRCDCKPWYSVSLNKTGELVE